MPALFVEMQERNHGISIIIPIFNEERRIAKCIERTVDYLNNHTNWDFEIIIANDASNDKDPIMAHQAGKGSLHKKSGI